MFVCPCIVRIIRNWWSTRCKFLFYLFVGNRLYIFGRSFRPSSGALDCIYCFWYSPHMLLPAGVVEEMEMQFHLVHGTGRQQHRWTVSEAVNTINCSWWWAKTSLETCRADWVQINKPKIWILLVINYELIYGVFRLFQEYLVWLSRFSLLMPNPAQ